MPATQVRAHNATEALTPHNTSQLTRQPNLQIPTKHSPVRTSACNDPKIPPSEHNRPAPLTRKYTTPTPAHSSQPPLTYTGSRARRENPTHNKTMASETQDQHLSASQTSGAGDESLSPLEQEVLDEYARLLGNLNNVRLASYISLAHTPHSRPTRCPVSSSTCRIIPAPRYSMA